MAADIVGMFAEIAISRGYAGLSLRARSSEVEHLTFNQRVVGSIPTGLTNYSNRLEVIRPLGAGSGKHS
jgi:hypothetical protein